MFSLFIKEIAAGKSVLRTTLNARLLREHLSGRILDLGSSSRDLYSTFIPRDANSTYEVMDMKSGSTVNFETDALPYADATFDTVLLLNVLEHIYNHQHLLEEIRRIKKTDGRLVGYVPFLMWYHPDHHDFFRYTHEALECMLVDAGYTDTQIEKIYLGPFSAAFHMIYSAIPRFLRPIIFMKFYLLDKIFRKVRAKGAERYVLGYYFIAK